MARPLGAKFFQCATKPWAFDPAIIIAKKVSVAKPAVTLKFPVTVAPPCKSLFTK